VLGKDLLHATLVLHLLLERLQVLQQQTPQNKPV
jgi:hypothetical protein